ncbi:MAG: hypothetical protein WHT06_10880 [Desulfobacterales bacterium]
MFLLRLLIGALFIAAALAIVIAVGWSSNRRRSLLHALYHLRSPLQRLPFPAVRPGGGIPAGDPECPETPTRR